MKNSFFIMMLCAFFLFSCSEVTDSPLDNNIGVDKGDTDNEEDNNVGSDDELKAFLSYITYNSAVVTVELGDTANIKSKGYLYSTNNTFPLGDREVFRNANPLKAYIGIMIKLKPDTEYFVRPFKIVGTDSIYGETVNFKTLRDKSEVTYKGTMKWRFEPDRDLSKLTGDSLKKYTLIKEAMDSALYYYNIYTPGKKNIKVNYKPSVSTANGSSGGTINFGSKTQYMCVETAMHETAHVCGVGTSASWRNYFAVGNKGPVQGYNVNSVFQMIRTEDDRKDIGADKSHFWPYNINYASDVKDESDLIKHVLMINGLFLDGLGQ